MNHVGEKEAEKAKEAKKAPSADSFAPYEDEAVEGYAEGLGPEDLSPSEADLSAPPCPPPRGSEGARGQERVGEEESWEERQQRLLREKWLTVTGRKPRSVPTVKRQQTEGGFVHFGDRRPQEVERKMREKWLQAAGRVKALVPNFGRVQKELMLPALCEGVLCVRFDRDGETMTTSYRDGGVQVRRAFSGEVLQTLWTLENKTRLPVRALRYNPTDGDLLYLAGARGVIQVFRISTANCVALSPSTLPQINGMDFTADGDNIVTAGRGGAVGIFDPETLELKSLRMWPQLRAAMQPTVEDEYHKMRIYGLRCHPVEPNLFLTGSWDGTVKVWDVRVPGAIRSLRGTFVCGEGVDVVGNTIVTASWRVDNSLHLWDLPSGKLIKQIPIQTKCTVFEGEFLYVARFFSDVPNGLVNSDCVAVGGSGFSSALVINTSTEKAIAAFPSYKATLTIDVWGSAIAYGGRESVFRVGEIVISEPKHRKVK